VDRIKGILLNQNRLFISIINFLFLLAIPLYYGVRYYNTDDIIRRQLLVGSGQFNQDSHMIFSANYIGKVFTSLYNLFPALEWYLVINSLLIILSIQILLLGSLQKNWKNNVLVYLFFLLFVILIGRDLITNVHFTIVSSLLAVASGFVFTRSHFEESISKTRKLIFAGILLFLGITFRVQSALLAFVFTCSAFLWCNCLLVTTNLKPVLRRYALNIAVIMGISFIPAFVAKQLEDKSYKEFRTTFDNHRALFDFKIQNRAKNAEKTFESAGWKEGHSQIFFTYMLPAVQVFSPYSLEQIVKGLGPTNFFRNPGAHDVEFLWNRYCLGNDYKLPFFLLLLIPLFFTMQNRWRGFLWLASSLIFYLTVIVILGIVLKFPGEYVTTPLLCSLFFIALSQIATIDRALLFSSMFLLVVVFYIAKNHQSETLQYIKNAFKSAEKPTEKQISQKINIVCLSQRSNDYVYPLQYKTNDWWRKADLNRAYYFGPFIWHPANRMSFRQDSLDLVFNTLNSNSYLWMLSNGYENDFIYDGFDEAVINFIKDQYNIKSKFITVERQPKFTLLKLVINQ